MDYEIQIEKFEGPFDLLLHLIKKNEIDIFDIPITEITSQYISYIEQLKSHDLDIACEFIVMAAKLIEIKSKMLLPPEEEEEDEENDPRVDLVQKLIEYKVYKQISEYFKMQEEVQLNVFYKDPEYHFNKNNIIEEIDMNELLNLYKNILVKNEVKNDEENIVHQIQRDEIKIEDKIIEISNLLDKRMTLTFSSLFSNIMSKQQVVVTFLAVLELIKTRLVTFKQDKLFEDILIIKLND